ncbi:MAG: hypothetical protein ABI883_03100, partial [Chthoniobacterales bacterium]
FWIVFGSFAVAWVCFFWPALHDAWWAMDDFWTIEWTNTERFGPFVLGIGRPLLGLWSYLFMLDCGPDHPWANVVLRWLHGGVHVLNATLIARLLWRTVPSLTAGIAPLPFLLWPFSADSVLWRGGSIYTLATFLSLAGLVLIQREPGPRSRFVWLLGSLGCGLGMLLAQVAAFAAPVLWTVLAGLTLLQAEAVPWPRLRREAFHVAGGLAVGAVISYWFMRAYPLPAYWARDAWATDPRAKLLFLFQLDWILLAFPRFYPTALKIAHLLIAAFAVAALGFHGWRLARRRRGFWRPALALLCLASTLILPYLPLLVVAFSVILLRTLYFGPVFLTACTAMSCLVLQRQAWLQRGSLLLVVGVLALYWPIARENAAEFVRCYRDDVAFLREVEAQARALGLQRVKIIPGMPFFIYNPHSYRYLYPFNHMNSLAYPVVRELFIRHWSHLTAVGEPEHSFLLVNDAIDHDHVLLNQALEQKKQLPVRDRPQFQRIEESDVMGIFMP